MRYFRLLLTAIAMAATALAGQDNLPISPRNIDALENESRDEWQKPARVIEALEIAPGATIADIGTGSGYFVARLSRAAGPDGKLFAVDIQQEMLAFVERKVGELGLSNVTTVLSQENDTRLDPASVDMALFVDVYHELRTPKALMSNIRRILKPNGRLVIIDFYDDREVPVGPPRRYRVPEQRLVAEVESVGFKLAGQHTFLPYQYFLIFVLDDAANAQRPEP